MTAPKADEKAAWPQRVWIDYDNIAEHDPGPGWTAYISLEEHAAIVSELVRAARVSAFNEAANYAEHYWGDTVVNGLREMAKKARAQAGSEGTAG